MDIGFILFVNSIDLHQFIDFKIKCKIRLYNKPNEYFNDYTINWHHIASCGEKFHNCTQHDPDSIDHLLGFIYCDMLMIWLTRHQCRPLPISPQLDILIHLIVCIHYWAPPPFVPQRAIHVHSSCPHQKPDGQTMTSHKGFPDPVHTMASPKYFIF